MRTLIENVKVWAQEKGIISPENAPLQFVKFIEEYGELAGALLKLRSAMKHEQSERLRAAKMELGDCFVVLIILSSQKRLNFYFQDPYIEKSATAIDTIVGMSVMTGDLSSVVTGVVSHKEQVKLNNTIFYLEMIASVLDSTPQKCLQLAYDKISKRKGKTLNGIFEKE